MPAITETHDITGTPGHLTITINAPPGRAIQINLTMKCPHCSPKALATGDETQSLELTEANLEDHNTTLNAETQKPTNSSSVTYEETLHNVPIAERPNYRRITTGPSKGAYIPLYTRNTRRPVPMPRGVGLEMPELPPAPAFTTVSGVLGSGVGPMPPSAYLPPGNAGPSAGASASDSLLSVSAPASPSPPARSGRRRRPSQVSAKERIVPERPALSPIHEAVLLRRSALGRATGRLI